MNFEPVDFNVYNKPPFYPEYLARGETKKLVSFDDKQFAELDRLIDKTSDQYDLDKVKGVLLTRLGNLLAENRNGNEDELYRLLVRLRILLNTTDGSINDIIKVIKFLYSSEVVHIVPNYPAALTIKHDGQQDQINFNKIIVQVIGAGIGYDTKEIFIFNDEFPAEEEFKIIKVLTSFSDSFRSEGIKFNGEIRHDGKHKAGGGISDRFSLILRPDNFVDRFEGYLRHNGVIKADGSHKFNGIGGRIGDIFRLKINYGHEDLFDVTDAANAVIKTCYTDYFSTQRKFNGMFRHDGTVKANAARDVFAVNIKIPEPFVDVFYAAVRHNGIIKADGSHKFNALGRISDSAVTMAGRLDFQDVIDAADAFTCVINQHINHTDYFPTKYRFDGAFRHDGQITASGSGDRLSITVKGINVTDRHRTTMRHNGTIKADGSHKFNTTGGISDSIVKTAGRFNFTENAGLSDLFTLEVKRHISLADYFPTKFRFDRTFKHDGKITASGSTDKLNILMKGINTADKHQASLRHNGAIKADGSHKFNGITGIGDVLKESSGYTYRDSVKTADKNADKVKVHLNDTQNIGEGLAVKASMPMSDMETVKEEFSIGLKYHRKHDGSFKANGKIKFNGGIVIPQ
ncbi:MAG: DUF2612 domain-containing protein [Treponema sp.]|jgi:hypothetical protein|nr:DUF2612 domain-containing protein [Treponema sp.]